MQLRTFAAYLVNSLGQVKGKKAFQKLVYLSKAEGIPFKNEYKMHYYGPYSDSVADELEAIYAEDVIDLVSLDSYIYQEGTKTEAVLSEGKKEIKKNKTVLERILKRYGKMSPRELEIYSTAHFVWRTHIIFNRPIDKDTIIREIKKAKYPKFDESEIIRAYNDLLNWDLISSN